MILSLEIFWVFFKLSMISFGGMYAVLPELERMIVFEHGWMSQQQFMQAYTITAFVPGPNSSLCPLLGYWVNGWCGFIAGFIGINLWPILLTAIVFSLYKRYQNLDWIRRSELALRPLVLGLFAASSIHLWLNQTEFSSHTMLYRSVAAVLTVLTGSLFVRKILTGTPIIFLTGGLWWAATQIVPFFVAP